MELAQQIKADFEESFQGVNAKVRLLGHSAGFLTVMSGWN